MPNKSGNAPASLDRASNSYSKQNGLSKDTREPLASIGTAAAHATFPSWMSVILMVSLIFGGCCANVRRYDQGYVEHFKLLTTLGYCSRCLRSKLL